MDLDALLISDAVRYLHLLAVAIGLGGAAFADVQLLTRLHRPVDDAFLATIRRLHVTVSMALGLLWATGVFLLVDKTGLDPALVTPKLVSKVMVVSILTLNASLIGRIAMPELERCHGRRPVDTPIGRRVGLALSFGVSSASWLLALAIGASRMLASSGWEVFFRLLPPVYAACCIAALFAAVLCRPVVRLVDSSNRLAERWA